VLLLLLLLPQPPQDRQTLDEGAADLNTRTSPSVCRLAAAAAVSAWSSGNVEEAIPPGTASELPPLPLSPRR
jgi:hypothetical protein